MKKQRLESQSGYILHLRPYRETSVLLDIFTEREGRVSLVARGVRKTLGKKNHSLNLFVNYDFSWIGGGRSGLYLMTSAETRRAAYLFSPYQLCCGLYLNELLSRVLPIEDPHPEIFRAYQTVLENINQNINYPKIIIETHLRLFEKNLLQNLGYGFCFERIETHRFYLFKQTDGLIDTPQKTAESISGESLLALENGKLAEKNLQDIKKLMRSALLPLIGQKPLRSRELFL